MHTPDGNSHNEKSPLLGSDKGSGSYGVRNRRGTAHDQASIEAAISKGVRPSLVGPGSYPVTLSWENVNVKVKVHGKRSIFGQSVPATEKLILDDVNGLVEPGSLVAIMGASGSGKSTLLNVLTNRNTKHYITSGTYRINGVEVDSGIQNISAYVQQDEMFMHTLTVREHLQFRALLRMDKSLNRRARMDRVEEVIAEMGLQLCSNSIIGAPGGTKKGISGGEKKRLSFASEALTDPPIFFCDEPTSSLDSFMARSVLQTLQGMAEKGATILCTIHQPASELFAIFSQLILLSEGRVAYTGKTQDCLEFFNKLGYPCPRKYNPADHYINTLAIKPRHEEECRKRTTAICDAFQDSPEAEDMLKARLRVTEQANEGDRSIVNVVTEFAESGRYKASHYTQITQLFWRAWTCQFRNSALFHIRVANSMFIAIFIGLMYLRLDVDQSGTTNINAAFFMILMQIGNDDLFAVLSVFPEEMDMAMREYCSGLYSLSNYYISKCLAELPMFCFTTVTFSSLTYWMIGFHGTAEAFFGYVGILTMLALVSVSLGYFSSIATGSTDLSLATTPHIVLVIAIFGGPLFNTNDTPDFMVWLEDVSWFKHTYQLLMINQWDDIDSIDCENSNTTIGNMTIPAKPCTFSTGQDVMKLNGIHTSEKYDDVAVLLAEMAGFYILGYVALYIRGKLAKE